MNARMMTKSFGRVPRFSFRSFSASPTGVNVYEVSPRDGLQNEPVVLSIAQKLEIIQALAEATPATVEACSFVREDRVPTMAGASEVCQAIRSAPWAQDARDKGVKFSALVLNKKGYERFMEHPLDEVALVVSCTDGHSKANAGKETMAALDAMLEVAAQCQEDGVGTRGYASMAFGCPIEGEVDPARVQHVIERYASAGVDTVIIADTIGVATPEQVEQICSAALKVLPGERLGLHMHDTYGRAVENCEVGLQLGVKNMDVAVGGTGGCPFAKGSAGNLATEDLLKLLARKGFSHTVDLDNLAKVNSMLSAALGRELVQY